MKPAFYFSLLALLVMAASTLFNTSPAQAQSGIELENVGASHQFGEQITFVATLKAPTSIQSASIVISDDSQNLNRVEALTLQPDGRLEFRLDTRQVVLHPFTTIKWSYQITLPDGSMLQSETFSTRYMDNRFEWQTLEVGTLKVNWYQGDATFGQAVLNAAPTALASVSQLMPGGNLAQPIEIFVYADTDALRSTLALGGAEWVAG
ncbi:MAG: hypothetical protein ACM33V_10525, partial [Chloroflexota bacterium]